MSNFIFFGNAELNNTHGGKKIVKEKKESYYKTKGGYYYRKYKNGKVKRISKEDYKKHLKFNSKVIKLKKVIKEVS